MKGHFYFCDNCGARERATLPARVFGDYTQPIGWIDLTENVSYGNHMNFCSRLCAVAKLQEVQA